MSQQVGITLGIPVMSAILTISSAGGLLAGVHTAIAVNAVLCLLGATAFALL